MIRTYNVFNDSGRLLARYRTTEPDDWDNDMGLFHKNESSWCSSNIFDAPKHGGIWANFTHEVEVLNQPAWDMLNQTYNTRDTCPCMHITFELAQCS